MIVKDQEIIECNIKIEEGKVSIETLKKKIKTIQEEKKQITIKIAEYDKWYADQIVALEAQVYELEFELRRFKRWTPPQFSPPRAVREPPEPRVDVDLKIDYNWREIEADKREFEIDFEKHLRAFVNEAQKHGADLSTMVTGKKDLLGKKIHGHCGRLSEGAC